MDWKCFDTRSVQVLSFLYFCMYIGHWDNFAIRIHRDILKARFIYFLSDVSILC